MIKDNCGLYFRYFDFFFFTVCVLSLLVKFIRIRFFNICKVLLFFFSSRYFVYLYIVYGNVILSVFRIVCKKVI